MGAFPSILRAGLICFLIILTPTLNSCAVNPATGERNFILMSKQQEIELGREQDPVLAQIYEGPVQDKKLQKYVSNLGHQLAEVSHAPNYPYNFRVVNSSTPNAYALPGGFVNITRGLLIQMDTEAELAAVLGHEIAHVTARHGAQQQSQGLMANVLVSAGQIALQTNDVQAASLLGDLGALGAQAYLASYSRTQEHQADRLGIKYTHQAGYDPDGMVQLQQLLLSLKERKPNAMEQLFSTHPTSEDRIADSREVIRNLGPNNVQGRPLNQFQSRVADVWHPRRDAYENYDRALQAHRDGNVDKALDLLNSAIDQYGGEGLFHAWKGILLTLEKDRVEDGRDALDRAVKLNDAVYRTWLFSGINHFYGSRHQESLRHLDKSDNLLEGVPLAMFYRGRNHEALGNQTKAREWYKKYLQTNPEGWRAEYARSRV